MQNTSLWRGLLGVDKTTIIEAVAYAEDQDIVVVDVRPAKRFTPRCGVCERRAVFYDPGEGPRRWRGLDLGTVPVYLQSQAPRVDCRVHEVTVAQVPWARHSARHTYHFEQQAAWLATKTSKTTVTQLMRIGWRTVGSMVSRVWAGVGRSTATLEEFFDALGEDRSAQITHVLADGTPFIAKVVAQRCPNAIRMADPFHVVKWATDALNDVRRQSWNEARQLAGAEPKRPRGRPAADAPPAPQSQRAKGLKGARFALLKNPEDLTQNQTHKLAWIVKADPRLYRAYLLKEGLRAVFKLPVDAAGEALDGWISWAKRCRIPEFVKLQRTIVKHQDQTLA
ncbi:MAG: transposase, partial [Yaniella sp.]|nr:transposase [Yaniella sp.]